jgi:hypothetical protein
MQLTLSGCKQLLLLLMLLLHLLHGWQVQLSAVTAVLHHVCCLCDAAGACHNALQVADCR